MTPLEVCVLATVLLWSKVLATTLVQAVARFRTKRFARPEDARWLGGQPHGGDAPLAVLGQLALRNDMENIPMFLLLLYGFGLLEGTPLRTALHAVVFFLSRCVHTIAYLRPTQPLRNVAYQVGVGTSVSLVGHILWSMG